MDNIHPHRESNTAAIGIMGGTHGRLLKHLARKWDIDKSVLTILATSAESLNEIGWKRSEIQNSKMPYNEAVSALAELDDREKSVWEELGKLNIEKNHIDSLTKMAYISGNMVTSSFFLLNYLNKCLTGNNLTMDEEEDEPKEYTLSDKIGDSIVGGIMKVGEIICAPFDWMTEKITSLM